MKKIIWFIVVSFLGLTTQGQSKYAADKSFKEFDYPKAVELYKSIHKKGDDSKLVLSRIADCYYFNLQTKDAEIWYKKLIDKYKNIDSKYRFRYAQTLKINGKHNLSDSIILKLNKQNNYDSWGNKLKRTPDYLNLYSKESGDVLSLHNVSVNTKYSDFGGFAVKDTLYFASTSPIAKNANKKLYKWNRQPFLNLYKASIVNKNNKLVELTGKEQIPHPIQTEYHESNAIITKNGKTMYFTRDNFDGNKVRRSRKDRRVRLKLYKAIKKDNKWTAIEELPFNSNEYSVGHPALSPDEKTLYFVSDMPGGYGGTDIYSVTIDENNKFGKPKNLGNVINTEGKEMFPFMTNDKKLYFSSDGHLGLGALDIFESKQNDKEEFLKVSNLKSPFNSNLDDFGFWINKDYTQGFFSSNRKEGKGDDDIYSFVLDRKQRPIVEKKPPVKDTLECAQVISGFITNSITYKIMPNVEVRLLDEEGKVLEKNTSSAKGFYSFKVACNTNYKISVIKKDFRPNFKEVTTTSKNDITHTANLELTPLIVEKQIKIKPIYFDFDKSNIRPDAQYELENVVSVLKNNPTMHIRIESHTDSRGKRSYNRVLSDKRAKSTRDYIISRGISSTRIISAIGIGEDKPFNHCKDGVRCTSKEHQQNRCSYFYIVK